MTQSANRQPPSKKTGNKHDQVMFVSCGYSWAKPVRVEILVSGFGAAERTRKTTGLFGLSPV
jgi:hypothetical protein